MVTIYKVSEFFPAFQVAADFHSFLHNINMKIKEMEPANHSGYLGLEMTFQAGTILKLFVVGVFNELRTSQPSREHLSVDRTQFISAAASSVTI